MNKVLLICGASAYIMSFRVGLIKRLQEEGYDVSVIATDSEREDDIRQLGVHLFVLCIRNRDTNPVRVRKTQAQYLNVIKTVNPDIVMTFMLKPNIYGTLAAHKAGVKNIFCMVEGAGDVFINNSLKWKLIRLYVCHKYRQAFKYAKKVIFLNNDDKAEFIERKLVKSEQCEVIKGIGVDLDRFAYKPVKNRNVFLMVARMLKTKGVFEYCKAARIVKQKYADAVFNYLGAEGTITLPDIKEYVEDGSINYLGTTSDVRPYLEDCTAFVLPSYREGFPMSIMEAEATGRAIITSNNIGCKDTVIDGCNGFLVEQKDYDKIAEKVIWCIEHPTETEQMCYDARKFAEESFDERKINAYIMRFLK